MIRSAPRADHVGLNLTAKIEHARKIGIHHPAERRVIGIARKAEKRNARVVHQHLDWSERRAHRRHCRTHRRRIGHITAKATRPRFVFHGGGRRFVFPVKKRHPVPRRGKSLYNGRADPREPPLINTVRIPITSLTPAQERGALFSCPAAGARPCRLFSFFIINRPAALVKPGDPPCTDGIA